MIHAKIQVAEGAVLNIFALSMEDRQDLLKGGMVKVDNGDQVMGPGDRMIFIAAETEEDIADFMRKIFADLPVQFHISNVDVFTV